MTVYQITQSIEIKFWNVITPLLADNGVLMKTMRATKRFSGGKLINIVLLIVIWAAIGFISGMLIGRIITLLQLL